MRFTGTPWAWTVFAAAVVIAVAVTAWYLLGAPGVQEGSAPTGKVASAPDAINVESSAYPYEPAPEIFAHDSDLVFVGTVVDQDDIILIIP